MASYELEGTVKVILEAQTFASGFTKRDFVVTTKEDRYPQDIKFECVKDRIAMLDSINEGDDVTVSFDLRGNEHNDRYYVNLQAWRIQSTGGERAARIHPRLKSPPCRATRKPPPRTTTTCRSEAERLTCIRPPQSRRWAMELWGTRDICGGRLPPHGPPRRPHRRNPREVPCHRSRENREWRF